MVNTEIILLIAIAGILLFIGIRLNDIKNLLPTQETKKKPVRNNEEAESDVELTDDEDYQAAKDYVIETGKASSSSLQTAFRWGYNKAARITNDLERFKVIGPTQAGQRYRKVLVKKETK